MVNPGHSVYVLTLADGYLYVGMSANLQTRLSDHQSAVTRNNLDHVALYVRSHGGPGQVNILATGLSRDDALSVEAYATTQLYACGYRATCHPWRLKYDHPWRKAVGPKRDAPPPLALTNAWLSARGWNPQGPTRPPPTRGVKRRKSRQRSNVT